MRRTLVAVVTIAITCGAVAQAAKFKSTWKAPDVETFGLAGKKVAAMVITSDQALQVSAEEELARQLVALGIQGVPSYRLIPREEVGSRNKAKAWFDRAEVTGVVVMRVVAADKEVTYRPDVWLTTMYADPWEYYAYGWGSAIGGVSKREDLVVTIETLIYDVTESKLMWAAVSEKTNPKGAQALVKELVAETVKEMKKQGVVKQQ